MSCLSLDGECPVEPVVDDVHAGQGELGADLMGDTCEDSHFQKRPLLVFDGDVSKGRERRDGMKGSEIRLLRVREPVMMRVDHPAEGKRRIVDEVVLQRSSDGDRTFDQCEVGFLHRLGRELRAQTFERVRRAGDKNESRRVRIDPMKGSCHEREVSKRPTFGIAEDDAVHERSLFAAAQRLNGHAGRFVEGQNGGVLEFDRERTGFRGDQIVGGFQKLDHLNRLAAPELESLRRLSSVDDYLAVGDGGLDEGSCC